MEAKLDAKGKKYLDRFRKIALALPEVVETECFGHPWFRAGGLEGKMISAFGGENGHWTACFKVGKPNMSLFLEDPRFTKTAYIGNHGWVSLRFDAAEPNWEEIAELLKTSYRNNAGKKLAAKLT